MQLTSKFPTINNKTHKRARLALDYYLILDILDMLFASLDYKAIFSLMRKAAWTRKWDAIADDLLDKAALKANSEQEFRGNKGRILDNLYTACEERALKDDLYYAMKSALLTKLRHDHLHAKYLSCFQGLPGVIDCLTEVKLFGFQKAYVRDFTTIRRMRPEIAWHFDYLDDDLRFINQQDVVGRLLGSLLLTLTPENLHLVEEIIHKCHPDLEVKLLITRDACIRDTCNAIYARLVRVIASPCTRDELCSLDDICKVIAQRRGSGAKPRPFGLELDIEDEWKLLQECTHVPYYMVSLRGHWPSQDVKIWLENITMQDGFTLLVDYHVSHDNLSTINNVSVDVPWILTKLTVNRGCVREEELSKLKKIRREHPTAEFDFRVTTEDLSNATLLPLLSPAEITVELPSSDSEIKCQFGPHGVLLIDCNQDSRAFVSTLDLSSLKVLRLDLSGYVDHAFISTISSKCQGLKVLSIILRSGGSRDAMKFQAALQAALDRPWKRLESLSIEGTADLCKIELSCSAYRVYPAVLGSKRQWLR